MACLSCTALIQVVVGFEERRPRVTQAIPARGEIDIERRDDDDVGAVCGQLTSGTYA